MSLSLGQVVDGKVTGITKFGAFVALPEGKSGMVHISEIAHTYVSDIREHLTEGQEVKVKIIGIEENGRINLSIKKAVAPPPRRNSSGGDSGGGYRPSRVPQEALSFEDKLKQFMQDSESRLTDAKHQADRKGGGKNGRRKNG